tara:strand:+ start:153 stop:401 length:249 start_codon:yes stop_codon:yes gene_type:complete
MTTERIRWDGKVPLGVGHVVYYSYCRGSQCEGVAVMRGRDGFEYWMKTLEGDNHFEMSNFVITVDVKLSECSVDDFERLQHR